MKGGFIFEAHFPGFRPLLGREINTKHPAIVLGEHGDIPNRQSVFCLAMEILPVSALEVENVSPELHRPLESMETQCGFGVNNEDWEMYLSAIGMALPGLGSQPCPMGLDLGFP